MLASYFWIHLHSIIFNDDYLSGMNVGIFMEDLKNLFRFEVNDSFIFKFTKLRSFRSRETFSWFNLEWILYRVRLVGEFDY